MLIVVLLGVESDLPSGRMPCLTKADK